jgi:hypothetical protein
MAVTDTTDADTLKSCEAVREERSGVKRCEPEKAKGEVGAARRTSGACAERSGAEWSKEIER